MDSNKKSGSKVLILGITFKQYCPDIRNSIVVEIYKELTQFDIDIYDSFADKKEVALEY